MKMTSESRSKNSNPYGRASACSLSNTSLASGTAAKNEKLSMNADTAKQPRSLFASLRNAWAVTAANNEAIGSPITMPVSGA